MAKRAFATPAEQEAVLDMWKTVVGVQMHFNDMLMRVRNLAVTLILAVFGAAAFSLQYELYFATPCGKFHLASLVVVFGLVAWAGMWFMDRYYNKLLAGAVARSTAIEDTYEADWLGMTHDITAESRKLFGVRDAMKARNQMALFLYIPVFVIGILYIVAVVRWFQPSYPRPVTAPSSSSGEGREASQARKAPQAIGTPQGEKAKAPTSDAHQTGTGASVSPQQEKRP